MAGENLMPWEGVLTNIGLSKEAYDLKHGFLYQHHYEQEGGTGGNGATTIHEVPDHDPDKIGPNELVSPQSTLELE